MKRPDKNHYAYLGTRYFQDIDEYIDELEQKLEKAREALEKYARPKILTPYGVAKQALEEIEK